MKRNFIKTMLGLCLFTLISCGQEWLDEKRDLNMVVPTTLNDFRRLLNNGQPMLYDSKTMAESSADDYYVTQNDYNTFFTSNVERNTLIWVKDIYEGEGNIYDWDVSYQQVFYANVVLEGLERITPSESERTEYNDIKGAALFHRAKAFFNLVETFARPFVEQTASSDLGIPIRLTADINFISQRATVKETYDRILEDLLAAQELLNEIPVTKYNPSKAAALGLLARIYLSMQKYEQALEFANRALERYDTLIDYNSLDTNVRYPFVRLNAETILYSQMSQVPANIANIASSIPDNFYQSYATNDLRRALFFTTRANGTISFSGSYSGSGQVFTGIATNEILFIQIECMARIGNYQQAIEVLNSFLTKRHQSGTFTNFIVNSRTEALHIILQERRKELLMRGLRWSDLKRLNQDTEFATTLYRSISGVLYTLPPGDPKYVLPIPDYIIRLSNIQQNNRE